MLHSLHLRDFRCHTDLKLASFSAFNLLRGANGKGKTSVLEAIYFLSRCRSFRTHFASELIHWTAAEFGLAGIFADEPFRRLKIEWSEDRRNLAVDDAENLSFRDFWGKAPAVIFQNDDRQIITAGALARRRWADGLLALLHPDYLTVIQRAQLLLKQKNALLRRGQPSPALWSALTDQLAETGAEIHRRRAAFTAQAAPLLQQFYRDLTGNAETLTIAYQPKIPADLALPRDDLRRREYERGAALLGPHRDDWDLRLFDKPLRDFGSEGQVKSAALSLRLLEAQLIRDNAGKHPLLLIDDALTDLDPTRRQKFRHLLPPAAQVFYATATPDDSILPADRKEIVF